MTKFSVIIPAYNCESTIENAVNSILASGLSDMDIIIIDDGSKDATGKICDMLSEKHMNVRCVHQENAGVSAARNRGIREASGEYIWFFDADDSVDGNTLSQVGEIINDTAPDMLVFGLEFDYYHNGRIYRRDEILPPIEGIKSSDECRQVLPALFADNCLSAIWNKIIRKSVVEDNSLMLREDMFLYEDLEFSLEVLNSCEKIYFLPKCIYRYRQPEDEGNAGRRLLKIRHIPDLIGKIEAALDAFGADNVKILLSLYITLAREKISVASKEDIDVICDDFRTWIDEHGFNGDIVDREYAMHIYNGAVSKLIYMSRKTKIRHAAANWIKRNIGDFRKW